MSGPNEVGGIRMDHVALASRHAWDQLTRYQNQLGGRWLGGPELDDSEGFYFCQVEFAGGTKIEILEPIPGRGSDFLRRFLDRNGPGPHHFTFKVDDFDPAVEACMAAGYDVVGIDRSEPDWHEAFLHPKQSHGIVIQLAYQGDAGWPEAQQLPPSLRATTPTLSLVEHLVADLESAVKLFAGPLAMEEIERGVDADGAYAILGSGPWRLKLIQPVNSTWQHWMGARPGRLLQLSFVLDDPGTIPGAEPRVDGGYELAPDYNLGTRLVLRAPDSDG